MFSSDSVPTLHLGIPALEALHRAWSSRADCLEYEPFSPALHVACAKIDEYYGKTTESPAYIMSMSMYFCAYTVTSLIFSSPQPKGENGIF